jgi:hypothetical protein
MLAQNKDKVSIALNLKQSSTLLLSQTLSPITDQAVTPQLLPYQPTHTKTNL